MLLTIVLIDLSLGQRYQYLGIAKLFASPSDETLHLVKHSDLVSPPQDQKP